MAESEDSTMSISDQEIGYVLRSFDMIKPEDLPSISKWFYEDLFIREPKLRAIFRDDLGGQGMKFMSTLKTIIVALRDPNALQAELKPLGEGHASLGVMAENFKPMGDALIDTFHEFLGSEFTPDMEAAWRAAYSEISKEMIKLGGIT